MGRASFLTLAFGIFFFDYDLDGLFDIFAGNGHVADDISAVQPSVSHAQPPHVFRNLGGRRFEEVTAELGPALRRPVVARGAANGDYDNDGDLDVLVNANGGRAVLYINNGANQSRFVRVALIGTRSNRDGIGARVTVTRPDGRSQWRLVHTGSSYCSQSDDRADLRAGGEPPGRVDRGGVAERPGRPGGPGGGEPGGVHQGGRGPARRPGPASPGDAAAALSRRRPPFRIGT